MLWRQKTKVIAILFLCIIFCSPFVTSAQSTYEYDTFLCRYFNVVLKPFGGCLVKIETPLLPSIVTTKDKSLPAKELKNSIPLNPTKQSNQVNATTSNSLGREQVEPIVQYLSYETSVSSIEKALKLFDFSNYLPPATVLDESYINKKFDLLTKKIESQSSSDMDSLSNTKRDLEDRIDDVEADSTGGISASDSLTFADLHVTGTTDLNTLTLDIPLGITSGGTGLSSYSTGDFIYASGANTLAKRTIGSTGDVLSVVAGVPTWVATSTLGISGGGASFSDSAGLAALLSDESGTGSVAYTTSPTFTGTISASAATLSSSLSLSGSAANIALTNNYLSGDGDDEGVTVSSAGEVGVGASTLYSLLTVGSGATNDLYLTINGDGAYNRGIQFRRNGTLEALVGIDITEDLNITNMRVGEMILFNTNSGSGVQTRMTILPSGYIGIGTTSPAEILTVAGNGYFGGNLTVTGTSTLATTIISSSTITNLNLTNALSALSGGTGLSSVTQNQLLIGGAGNTWSQVATSSLGLSPTFSNSSQLGTLLSDESGTGVVAYTTNSVFTTPKIAILYGGTTNSSSLRLRSTSGSGTTDYISFGVGNSGATEVMRIFNSSNVAIGTTLDGGAKLAVNGGANTNTLTLVNDSSTPRVIFANAGLTNFASVGLFANGLSLSGGGDPTVSSNIFINDAGDVGIGTTTPNAKLTISASQDTAVLALADTTNNDQVNFYTGTTSPEGRVSAPLGSLFVDSQNGAMYQKTANDNTSVGWSSFVTSTTTYGAKMVRASAQSILHNTETVIDFDTEIFDDGDIADTSTDRITITRTGRYLVMAGMSIPNLDIGEAAEVFIAKNGTAYTDMVAYSRTESAGTNHGASPVISQVLLLSAGDYLTFIGSQYEGSAQNTQTNEGQRPYFIVLEMNTYGLGGFNSGGGSSSFSNSGELAALLGDETGTGLAVFNTNPAFTTGLSTPAITTASGDLTVTPAAGSNFNLNLSTTGDFAVNTNQLYVDTSTGFVGMGTTTPSAKLSVAGTTYFGGDILAAAALSVGGAADFSTTTTTGLATFSSGVSINAETITDFTGTNFTNSGGSLGLNSALSGITTINRSSLGMAIMNTNFAAAGTALVLSGGTYSQSAGSYIGVNVRPTYNQTGTSSATDFLITRTETAVGSGAQYLIDAQVNTVSLFNLTNTGNVGIGTTTGSSKLTVVGSINSTDLLGGATTLSTDANGNIIKTPSDARLKTDVTEIHDALETVLALRGVRYKWIDKNRFGDMTEVGFIAQEVDTLIPEVVRKGGEYWTLNTPNILAFVVEAIKEMWTKVTSIESDVDDLKLENEALKARINALESNSSHSSNNSSNDSGGSTNTDQPTDDTATSTPDESNDNSASPVDTSTSTDEIVNDPVIDTGSPANDTEISTPAEPEVVTPEPDSNPDGL